MQSSCLASASSSLDGSRKQFRQWNTPSDLVPAIRAIGQWYWQIDIVHMLQSRLDEAIVWLEKARRGPGLCETRTLCWRNRDSNAWSPATSMMPARPSLAPGAHASSGRRDQLVHRGDRRFESAFLQRESPTNRARRVPPERRRLSDGQLTQLWERPFDRPPRGWHRRCRRVDLDRLPSESTGTLLSQYQSAACCSVLVDCMA